MKRSRCGLLVLVLIGVVVGSIAAPRAVRAQPEPIRLGVVFPIASLYGQQTNAGLQLALKEVNDRGGILGRQLRTIILDDQDKPEEGVATLERLITRDKVHAVAASFSSLTGLAEQKVTERYRVLHLAIAGKADRLRSEGHPLVFYLNSSISQDSKTFNEFLAKRLHPKRVAVMLENTDYGQGGLDSIKRDWSAAGSPEIITVERFEKLEQDFTPLLTRVKSLSPEMIYIVTGTVEVNANIVMQIDQLGLKATKVLSPGQLSDDFVRAAGKSAEGVISADLYVNTIDTPENRAFVSAFEALNKTLPQKMSVLGYETLSVFAQAIAQAGTAENIESIAAVLRSAIFSSPRGKVRFLPMGKSYQAEAGLHLLTITNGKIMPYR